MRSRCSSLLASGGKKNRRRHSYFLAHVAGEPRTLVKASPRNGPEAWRRLKERCNLALAIAELGYISLHPTRNGELYKAGATPPVHSWGSPSPVSHREMGGGLPAATGPLGSPSFQDDMHRAILITTAPDELATHLKFDSVRFDRSVMIEWRSSTSRFPPPIPARTDVGGEEG